MVQSFIRNGKIKQFKLGERVLFPKFVIFKWCIDVLGKKGKKENVSYLFDKSK